MEELLEHYCGHVVSHKIRTKSLKEQIAYIEYVRSHDCINCDEDVDYAPQKVMNETNWSAIL